MLRTSAGAVQHLTVTLQCKLHLGSNYAVCGLSYYSLCSLPCASTRLQPQLSSRHNNSVQLFKPTHGAYVCARGLPHWYSLRLAVQLQSRAETAQEAWSSPGLPCAQSSRCLRKQTCRWTGADRGSAHSTLAASTNSNHRVHVPVPCAALTHDRGSWTVFRGQCQLVRPASAADRR